MAFMVRRVTAVRAARRSLRNRLEESGGAQQAVRCVVDAMTPLLQQICDERLWQQHEGSFLAAVVEEHEREMRPLLALKGALGSRAMGDGQGSGLAAANKKKTEAAVHVARVAAVKEAQSEQALLRQAFLRKEQQLATQLKRVETEKMHALELRSISSDKLSYELVYRCN